jgi:HEAT repeat protein
MDWRAQRDQALLILERSPEEDARTEAAENLRQLATESEERWGELATLLPKLLEDRHPGVRREAVALAAVVLDGDEAERVLASKLKDVAVPVRSEAAGHLADLARPSARGALAIALEDEAFAVRFEGARGMAVLRHPAGLSVLLEALEHDDFRFRSLGALAELGDRSAVPAIEKVFKRWFLPGFERTQAAGALVKLGQPTGAQHLIERTRKRWSPDRALAIELLGEVKVEGARTRLEEILRDGADSARGAAARGLGRLGDRAVLPLLLAMLEDPKLADDLRLDVAEGVFLLRPPEGRKALERALPHLKSTEAREELESLLEESAWS